MKNGCKNKCCVYNFVLCVRVCVCVCVCVCVYVCIYIYALLQFVLLKALYK